MVYCRDCGLARNLLDYTYDDLYMDEAGIYHPLNQDEFDEWIGRAGPLEKILSRFVDSPGEMLDYGCNVGYTMQIFQDVGWKVRGVDLNPSVIEDARRRGFSATHSRLEDAGFEDNTFDLITMTHILEHLPEPEMSLGEVRRVLKPGGLLLIAVPNFGSRLELLWFGGRWTGFAPKQHIWYFKKDTLSGMISRYGFEKKFVGSRSQHFLHRGNPVHRFLKILLILWERMADDGNELVGIFRKTEDD
jgi:SAM-dependent methyltransferase